MKRHGDWIQTHSGRQFWPLDPRPEDVNIWDVAHALSMLCRFGGHCQRFYSVAEHCVLLSRHVPQDVALWALLHDASEAYLVDVPRPIKRHLGGYVEAETKIMHAVCARFRLPFAMPALVSLADTRILVDEARQNMSEPPMLWNVDAEPLGIELQCWSPDRAKSEFLGAFDTLWLAACDTGLTKNV